MKFKRAIPREILIRPSANGGFIVQNGCCEVVFEDKTDLVAALESYLEFPATYEKLYNGMERPPQEEAGEPANTVQTNEGRGELEVPARHR